MAPGPWILHFGVGPWTTYMADWAHGPLIWTGSMDHLYGLGPWSPCNGLDPCHPQKKLKKEKGTINTMQIHVNSVQQCYRFSDNNYTAR